MEIDPVRLTPGTYLVGATYGVFDADVARNQATAETPPPIRYLGNRSSVSPVLTVPTTHFPADDDAFLGPAA